MSSKSLKTKKKLCWNCEGNVSFEDEHCLYCGVYLSPESSQKQDDLLFSPPYRARMKDEPIEADEIPPSPYMVKEESEVVENEGDHLAIAAEEADARAAVENLKTHVFSLGLLSSGLTFFIFALALAFFNENGTLTVRWKADFWYLYLGFGLAALIGGGWLLKTRAADSES